MFLIAMQASPRAIADETAVRQQESTGPAAIPETIEFNRDVRPILSDKCFRCHGPDRNSREADLRLDTEAGLVGTGDSTGAVTPGKLDESELFRRISSLDDDERMPPPGSNKELSPHEIAILRRWIEQGANYQGHWAYLPLRTFTADELPRGGVSESATIDAFVAAERVRQGLTAAPRADRVTLLRRLSFDLTGLPPTPAEVATFVNNSSADAYAQEVDRLLASPHFGERMAMWWLDLVRYADTVGYHGDQDVSVSPFRDYVINAFNSNKPFDQFTIEQLAGDLLPEPSQTQLIASGYNRLGMMSAEGGVQDKEYLAKYIAERVRNVSGAWLGVTMGCCECHDHKFDPFPTREFYQMEAFFADIKERGLYSSADATGNWGPSLKVPTEPQQARMQELLAQIAAVEATLNQSTPELVAAQAEWELAQPSWVTLLPEELVSEQGATLKLRKRDGSIIASGESPATDTYTLTFPSVPEGIAALRLEVLPDKSLPQQGPGRAGNGNFVLTELIVRAQAEGAEPRALEFAQALASHEQIDNGGKNPYGKWPAAAAIDHELHGDQWGWAILNEAGKPQAAVFCFAPDQAPQAGETVTIELQQKHKNPSHTLGRFRISATTSAAPEAGTLAIPAGVAAALAVPVVERSDAQAQEIAKFYRTIAPALEPTRVELAALQKSRAELDAQITTTLITEAVEPRPVRVLPRGNWMDDSGEVVFPGVPAVLVSADAPLPADRRLTRLDLAQWITSPENPLTARVLANRLWKLYLGAGLSRKLDDIGAQGEPPTHPLLLDYLARRLIDFGWDIKGLIRAIVLSETYQQSSVPTAATLEADPENRWLARQARFRLDAEMVRDNALAVSGLLADEIGGPSVKPYQPRGYWAYLNFPAREWQNGTGEELYRRGLYTHWQRQYLHPGLLAFDAPSREECTADRARSNTPLQSLVLLNDPCYVEAARTLAERMLRHGATTQERLDFAYQQAVSRGVKEQEVAILSQLLEQARSEYQANPQAAGELLSVGARPVPDDLDTVELAAWTTIARAILNLHETITRN